MEAVKRGAVLFFKKTKTEKTFDGVNETREMLKKASAMNSFRHWKILW